MKFYNSFIFFFLGLIFWQMFAIANMPEFSQDDKKKIEKLFSYLVLDEGFAYVLFGSKPMSTTGFDNNIQATCEEMGQHPMFELESLWHTWEKYSDYVPMNDFVLFAQRRDEWFEIFLINKLNALNIIKDNLVLFREKLSKNLTPREIIDNIVASRSVFRDGLNKSQALFGLLLGYGKKNAVGFENHFTKNRKAHFLFPKKSAEIVPIEMDELIVPCFASFSNKETNRIIKKYLQERNKIIEIYSKGDFLETTLSRLASHQE